MLNRSTELLLSPPKYVAAHSVVYRNAASTMRSTSAAANPSRCIPPVAFFSCVRMTSVVVLILILVIIMMMVGAQVKVHVVSNMARGISFTTFAESYIWRTIIGVFGA